MNYKLPRIFTIFDFLNQSGIRYAHFKSTEHLDASFSGLTDFDLLVHPNDYYKIERFLLENQFKRRLSTFNKSYPAMHDFLYYDHTSDQFHHFHVHTQLIFGSKHTKSYTFTNMNWLFENSKMHDSLPIKIVPPEYELFLLVCRLFSKEKISIRRLLQLFIKQKFVNANMGKEFDYLDTACGNQLHAQLDSLFSTDLLNYASLFLEARRTHSLNSLNFLFYFFRITSLLKKYRSENNILKSHSKIRKSSKKYSTSWLGGGIKTIAILGVDGSGKSSTIEIINHWLRYKLSVQNVYMGRPKNMFKDRILPKIKQVIRILGMGNIGDQLENLYYAQFRKSSFSQSQALLNSGVITLFDRYPLREFHKMEKPMDGPRIDEKSYFAPLEQKLYEQIDLYPNLLIILKIPLDVAIKRKPEHSGETKIKELKTKIVAIEQLESTLRKENVLFVDAKKSQKETILEIKSFIWSNL